MTETSLENAEVIEAPEATEATETPEVPAESPAPSYSESFVFDRPIQTVGRRKEAVVRVRLVPGTGKFNLNGRTL